MSEHIKVSVFMPCFNESEIIRDTIKHYRTNFPSCAITFYDNFSTDNSVEIAESLGCNVIKWNTGNKIDDTKLRDLKNSCWKNVKDGWIIMADMDEWLCMNEAQLIEEDKKDVTIIKTKGFNMCGDSQSISLDDIDIQTVNKGHYSPGYSKKVCFKRTKISDINYEHGAHECSPVGKIKYSRKEYTIKHMVHLGLPFLIEKMKMKHKRSHEMRQRGLAVHYTNDTNLITERYTHTKTSCITINPPFSYMLQDSMSRPQKELKFIHITKTAGTSIEDEGTKQQRKWGRHHEEYGWWHELFPRKSKEIRKKYDWFMVVRNPYKRLISEMHYIFPKITDNDEFNKQLAKCLNYLLTNKDNFSHPYQRAQGDHFTEQHRYLDSSSVIHVLYFEAIKQEFEALMSVYNYNPIRLNKTVYKSKNIFDIRDISNSNIDLINSIYKKDFDTFGYTILDYETIQNKENLYNLCSTKRYIHNRFIEYNDYKPDQKINIDKFLDNEEIINEPLENEPKKYAIVLLTVTPSEYLIKVAKSLKNTEYTIFICADSNTYKSNDTDINIIQYNNDECITNGYKGSSFLINKNGPIAWDKALYHFCVKDTSYDYIWFIEDDVYIPDSKLISIIDTKYQEDILSKANIINETGELNWHWGRVKNNLPLPWMRSLVCAVRLSKPVLNLVKRYVKKNNTLLFIEFIFHTLALHKNLKINAITELSGIEYRKDWSTKDFSLDTLYHPVKREIHTNDNFNELKYIPISRIANKYMTDIAKQLNVMWDENHTEYGWRFEKFINKPTSLKSKYDWLLIVRDPYTRILSEYNFLKSSLFSKANHNVQDFNRIIANWINNVESGIENNPKFGRKIGDHFTEQYNYYDENIKTHIIKYENLQEELNTVLVQYNYNPITIPFEIETQFIYTLEDISDDNIKLINRVYRRDFELFNYDMKTIEPPLKKQLKYIHITRAAGTSIEQVGLDENKLWGRYDREYGLFDEPFSLKSNNLKNSYDWFIVVRNPYTRLLSEYNYLKIVLRIKNADDPKTFNTYIEKWLTIIKNNPKQQIYGYHLIPQYKYIDTNYKINILKYENINNEFHELMNKYQYSVRLSKIVGKTNKILLISDLSHRNIELIKEVYKNDFEHFGYSNFYSV